MMVQSPPLRLFAARLQVVTCRRLDVIGSNIDAVEDRLDITQPELCGSRRARQSRWG